MISIRGAVVAFLSGFLFASSWVVFIDGQTAGSHDAFPPLHILPPLVSTLAAIMVNLVSVERVARNNAVKLWLFIWLSVQGICIGSSIYILSTKYYADDNYPGVSLLLQTVIMAFAGLLFFVGRKPCGGNNNDMDF